jgi:hypothetical protein
VILASRVSQQCHASGERDAGSSAFRFRARVQSERSRWISDSRQSASRPWLCAMEGEYRYRLLGRKESSYGAVMSGGHSLPGLYREWGGVRSLAEHPIGACSSQLATAAHCVLLPSHLRATLCVDGSVPFRSPARRAPPHPIFPGGFARSAETFFRTAPNSPEAALCRKKSRTC